MEFRLRPLRFMEFFSQNKNPQEDNKMLFCKKLHETQGSQSKDHEFNIYIYLIYINLLLLLYSSSILDIVHSPYYIALRSTQTHKVI